jgi:uncharacterized lipoprotein YmbA
MEGSNMKRAHYQLTMAATALVLLLLIVVALHTTGCSSTQPRVDGYEADVTPENDGRHYIGGPE